MAIATLDQYIAAVKQKINITKTASRTSVATIPFSCFNIAGSPGAGTLAGDSTTAPVMPTDATAGCPKINFDTGIGYLSKLSFRSSVAGTLDTYDLLSKSGAYAFDSGTTTIDTPLDISSRCPDYPGSGTDFGNNLEIWIEIVTAMTSATAFQVQVTYTNQAGTAAQTSIVSAAQAAAALTVGKMFQLALQSGDSGVQAIESVIVTTGAAAAGTFNVLILRPLVGNLYVPVAGSGDSYDMLKTGLPIIYADSALIAIPSPNGTASGIWNVNFEVASA